MVKAEVEVKKEEKKEEAKYFVGNVPETWAPAIIERDTNKAYNLYDVLAKLACDVEEIKKSVVR
jgi:hypothetical protein